jgi:predicted nucleotide-binding protein (sugar kinase/HSP70/actin superfamily)
VAELLESCDYVFIPKIVKMEKGGFSCPKMIGFSDMIRQNLNVEGWRIIDPIFEYGKFKLEGYFARIALKFTKNPVKILGAVKKLKYEMDRMSNTELRLPNRNSKKTVGLVGHPYNVFDPFVNMNIITELRSRNVEVVTSNNVPPLYVTGMFEEFPGNLFWSFGREIYSVSSRMLENKIVDGLIYIIPFSCGLDSVLMGIVEEKASKENVPFMPLYVDEHTEKAAFLTRIEAFIDMIS